MRIRMIPILSTFIAIPMLAACAATAPSNDTSALNDTGWTVSGLPGQTLLPDRQITMHFENGRIHGTDGCNRYSASYTSAGGKFNVGKNIVSTKMACPESVMQQAEDFLIALSNASALRRDARQLVLLDANGKAVAILAAQRRELSGTSWLVTSYNNGKQAVVNVLAGSALTVDFSADGSVSGSAGCNNYTAIYAASGKSIKIGQAAASKKMCVRPEGVMEQEGRFLKALQTVAAWRLEGDRLELRTAEGALAVTLSTAKGFHSPSMTPAKKR